LGVIPDPDALPVVEVEEASETELQRIRAIGALPYEEFLRMHFPHVATAPLAERHHRAYRWGDSIGSTIVRPHVAPWPRGGGKSTTAEILVTRLACRGTRRFVLFVSSTQAKANARIQALAKHLEVLGVGRDINTYGQSRGWTRQLLRTNIGFNAMAVGLDVGMRGVKLDEVRPDLIVIDDVDERDDTPATTKKRIDALTMDVLPAGGADCAVLVLQNLIHEDSIVSQLYDGRAKFLLTREVVKVDPAAHDLAYELQQQPDGSYAFRVLGGMPTWEGQTLETIERQLNDWGEEAFLREAQHKVNAGDGLFFDVDRLETIEPEDVPDLLFYCRAFDFAGTRGGGDWSVGALEGIARNAVVYILDVARIQETWDELIKLVKQLSMADRKRYGRVRYRFPQDPAQAGKAQAIQLKQILTSKDPGDPDWIPMATEDVLFRPVTTRKAANARGFAGKVSSGNARMVRANWNAAFKTELRRFKEDDSHDFDDQVDAGSDAYNVLAVLAPKNSDPLRPFTVSTR
jgi:predicted phage terminase large subunit-like protein